MAETRFGSPSSSRRPTWLDDTTALVGPADRRELDVRPGPVIAAKLAAPSLPRGTVKRPQLIARLASAERVALVVAPPGYGKTVTLSQWADTCDDAIAWISVDLLDADAESFWRHVIRGVRSVMPQINDEPELLLAERGAADPMFLGALIAQIEHQPERAVLVLDDLGRIQDRATLDGLALLVERVGDRLRWMITSRSDPRLPIARWRSAGWAVDLRQEHLRLDDAEALAVAATFADIGIGDEEVAALNGRVGGWPIALHLALVSIGSTPQPSERAHVLAESDRLLSDYLITDVFDQLPATHRDVALSLSVVEFFDGDLCRDLIGPEAITVVRDLWARRLFVSLVDERTGAMRFHSLIRDLLEQELRWSDPHRHADLHRRAAGLWAARSDFNRAYRHLAAIGDVEGACALILAPALELVDRADRVGLHRMLASAPGRDDVEDAALALDLAAASLFAGRQRDAEEWCARAEQVAPKLDRATALRLHTTRAMVALLAGDLADAREHITQHEALATSTHSDHPMDVRFATTGARVLIASGRLAEAEPWVSRAASITSPLAVVAVTTPALQAWFELASGRLGRASELAELALSQAEQRALHEHHGAFDATVVAAWCRLGAGDLPGAARLAEVALSAADGLGLAWNRIRAATLVAEVRRLTTGPASALGVIRDRRLDLRDVRAPELLVALDVVEAAALVGSDQAHQARPIIERLEEGPRQRLLLAGLAMADGRPSAVGPTLRASARWTAPEALEAELLLAAAEHPTYGVTRATAALGEGARTGWVAPFLGHGEAIERLLRRLPIDRIHPALGRCRSEQAGGRSVPVLLSDPLTEREVTILRLLPTHLSYAQIGEQLFLSVNTVKSNLKSVYRRLNVASRSEAVEAGLELGLLDDIGATHDP